MLPGGKRLSGQFPLGPFPRHIWIHSDTPQDGLDTACYEIWKRVQQASEESTALVPLLQYALCSDISGTPPRDASSSQSSNYLLGEPEGLESIYRAVIGNRDQEMKLRALCDLPLSAKSVITSLLHSAKPHKNSKGLEDSSMTGDHSTESSKLVLPFLLEYTDTARNTGSEVVPKGIKVVKEFVQKGTFGSAKSSAAVASTTAASHAAGQKQQLSPLAKICSKTDSNTVTKKSVTTATPDKRSVTYNASTSGCFTTIMTRALNQPVPPRIIFIPFPISPGYLIFPQFQGPYQRARIPYQQALHPSFGCYSRQVVLYNPQQILQPLYAPILNSISLVQPGYPYQQVTPPTLPGNIQDLLPTAGNRIQYPLSPSYGFSSTPEGV
ncbi:uncharacterized protein C1orf94 homolog [Athene noctua]|uniref:uncharacterized protein C1orf94 homolog n=1 Tax=Athene noctua TaxID=126797 RepID=UPI003EC08555